MWPFVGATRWAHLCFSLFCQPDVQGVGAKKRTQIHVTRASNEPGRLVPYHGKALWTLIHAVSSTIPVNFVLQITSKISSGVVKFHTCQVLRARRTHAHNCVPDPYSPNRYCKCVCIFLLTRLFSHPLCIFLFLFFFLFFAFCS